MNNETYVLPVKEAISERTTKTETKFQIAIHKQNSAISKLHTEWAELAEISNQPICMSPEWARCWWKHLGRHKRRSLYIITVHDNNQLIAIFPFYKGISSIGGVLIEQRLQLIGSGGNKNELLGFSDDYGISDFLDFIVHPDYIDSIADLFISLVKTSDLSNHHIRFHQVRDDSFIRKYLYPKLIKADQPVKAKHTDSCPYIDLTEIDSMKAFIKQRKSNARRRFRQTLRATGNDNDFMLIPASKPDDLSDMISNLITLHQDRWNEIGFPGAFNDYRFRKFFKEIVFNAYQNNRLWFKQAVDSSGVCASRMLLYYNNRYYDYMTGFNDNSPSARRRPGIGLLLNLIEESIGKKSADRIELLRGEEGYKEDFTGKKIKNWKITIPVTNQERAGFGIMSAFLHSISIIYKNLVCELTLMKVQFNEKGLLKMIGGYLRFRKESIKNLYRSN